MNALTKIELPNLQLINSGKVRDLFYVNDNEILFVASDRISAFDVIMSEPIPQKGQILTSISLFWFDFFSKNENTKSIKNHLVTTDVDKYPENLREYKEILQGRSMLVKKLNIVPIECIVRGYLAGSGWKEYQKSQTVCDIPLPSGLKESEKLPEVLFTPSTKEESGHDINISPDKAADIVGKELAEKLADYSIKLYKTAAEYATTGGIIIADTKFEFGIDPDTGELILADEVLTPDSSRFWNESLYEIGKSQDSFDKQYLRDWLETVKDWNKEYPAPTLPENIIVDTNDKYLEAYHRLTNGGLTSRKIF